MSGELYRFVMKVAHKYHWHYAPPIYPEGDVHLWCKWCGFRQTIATADQRRHWGHNEIDQRHCSQCASQKTESINQASQEKTSE